MLMLGKVLIKADRVIKKICPQIGQHNNFHYANIAIY